MPLGGLRERHRWGFVRTIRITTAVPVPIGDDDVLDAAVRGYADRFQRFSTGRVAAGVSAGNVRNAADAPGVSYDVVVPRWNRHPEIWMGGCAVDPPPGVVIQVEEHDHDG